MRVFVSSTPEKLGPERRTTRVGLATAWGSAPGPFLRPFSDDGVGAVRSVRGADGFEREWAAGRQLRPADALAQAREELSENFATP